MSETTDTTAPIGRRVEVTYTERKTVTVYVNDNDFTADLGPVAKSNAFGPRIGSLMTGWVDRHRDEFPEIPKTAEIVYVDPERDDN